MPPFLSDFKKGELIRLMKNGLSIKETAEEMGVSETTVTRWWRRYQEEGEEGVRSRRENCGRKRRTSRQNDEEMVAVCIALASCVVGFRCILTSAKTDLRGIVRG